MIEKLIIKNFQAHRSLEVQFSPTVTTIIGSSDVGKSAILRALRWICFNSIRSGFQRRGSKKTIVKLEVDGHKITRKRIGVKNVYTFDEKKFAAFGSKVPPRITNTLRLVEAINFQEQHDPPFWFTKTPGQVSRELNSIVDLGIIDKVLSAASSQVKKTHSILEITKDRYRRARGLKVSLQWVSRCSAEFSRIERSKQDLETLAKRRVNLGSLVQELTQLQLESSKAQDKLVQAQELQKQAGALRRTQSQINELSKLINLITKAQVLSTVQVPSINKLEGLRTEADSLFRLISQIQSEKDQLCRTQEKLHVAQRTIKSKTKNRCPVCGQKIKTE